MHKTKLITVAFMLLTAYANPTFVTNAEVSPIHTAPTPSVAQKAPQTLRLRVTAYTSIPDETDDTPFITANGTYVHDGVVATNLLPFGTKVEIPSLFGDKIFIVEDRMSKRLTKNIDIWMPTRSKALVFGAHNAEIVILQDKSTDLSLR